ncbi:MAG: hypothetical protein LBR15_09205 [Methanobrevibacter sp.]|nr:hypothetical protein [Candidatus Methanovirga australis]
MYDKYNITWEIDESKILYAVTPNWSIANDSNQKSWFEILLKIISILPLY